jgi:hypothetical protein
MYWDIKHGQEHAAWTRNCSAWTWTCRVDKYMSSSCSCCMFVFMLHAACHAPCCMLHAMPMPMLQAHAHAASPCRLPMFMLHVRAHPAFHVHAACSNTNCVSMSIVHANVYAACPCPCCISMSVLHDHVHAVYPCPCCMSMSMLHVQVSSMDMDLHHEQVHAAWTSLLHVHFHLVCPCPCCLSVLLPVRVHA